MAPQELSYDEFLYFFASLRKLLPERHFRQFVVDSIEQFNLHVSLGARVSAKESILRSRMVPPSTCTSALGAWATRRA